MPGNWHALVCMKKEGEEAEIKAAEFERFFGLNPEAQEEKRNSNKKTKANPIDMADDGDV